MKYSFVILFLFSSIVLADDRIHVTGLKKTSLSVVEREYDFVKRNEAGVPPYQALRKRLLSLQIFSQVVVSPPDENKVIYVNLEEKWTTIPVLKFSSGGGLLQTTVGVYDPNLFGKYLESGIQYEQLGTEGSGVVWFKNPRFLNKSQLLDIQYWKTRRLRLKYDQNEVDPVEKQAFVLERERFYLGYEPSIGENLNLKFLLEQNVDQFRLDSLNDEQRKKFRGIPLPSDVSIYQIGLGLDWGALDVVEHRTEGMKLSLLHKHHWEKNQVAHSFSQTDLTLHLAKLLNEDLNYVQRILLSMTDTSLLQYWSYFGGLDRIRGFSDNRFSGRYSALSNSELRSTWLQKKNWILQNVLFLDLLSTTEKFADLDRLKAASAGGGLRIILPKIYRAVVRIDYAKPLIKNDEQQVSFGLQQFF